MARLMSRVHTRSTSRPLLRVVWNGDVFMDAALSCGSGLTLNIFKAVADAVEWVVRKQGVIELWHCFDDYIACSVPSLSECGFNLLVLKKFC